MTCLCARTRLAARQLTRLYEAALRPVGLTPAQFELMAEIKAHPLRSQADLAEALALDQTTLSRNLKLLVTRGLLTRGVASTNRRQCTYAPTSAGSDLLQTALPLWQSAQKTMQQALGEDWPTTHDVLARLNQAAAAIAL